MTRFLDHLSVSLNIRKHNVRFYPPNPKEAYLRFHPAQNLFFSAPVLLQVFEYMQCFIFTIKGMLISNKPFNYILRPQVLFRVIFMLPTIVLN